MTRRLKRSASHHFFVTSVDYKQVANVSY